ncbi:MAG TPA: T9SS type A sorting domain-containing protein [Ignavibacteriaceae bacterium]|nr:T9SS type A sorting domain-containing protein [Ignavibacteriaceae bacterium]
MKAQFICYILFICLPIVAQDFVKQISQIDNDARNLKFVFDNTSVPPNERGEYTFESHFNGSINIYFGYYNALSDSFYDQIPLTNNSFQNKNSSGISVIRNPSHIGKKTFIIYQSNKNGKWDLAARVKEFDLWSEEKILFNTSSDLINPVLFNEKKYGILDSVRFMYTNNNSVYLATWQDSVIRNFKIFENDDSTYYSNYSSFYEPSGFGDYLIAQKNRTGLTPQIVRRTLTEDGILEPEVIIIESPTLINPGVVDFGFKYEDIVNGKRNILFWVNFDSTQNYKLKDNPAGDLSDFCAAGHFTHSMKKLNNYKYNYFWQPFSYKMHTDSGTFIRVNPGEYTYYGDDFVPTRVLDTKIDVSFLTINAPNNYVVSYTAWEDITDGKIGILGRKCLTDFLSVDNNMLIPSFHLHQNYPNPFNPATNIRYNLTERGVVIIKVFDLLGNELKTLINEEQNAGEYNIDFDASGFSSGVYFYRMQINNSFQTKKMVLIR